MIVIIHSLQPLHSSSCADIRKLNAETSSQEKEGSKVVFKHRQSMKYGSQDQRLFFSDSRFPEEVIFLPLSDFLKLDNTICMRTYACRPLTAFNNFLGETLFRLILLSYLIFITLLEIFLALRFSIERAIDCQPHDDDIKGLCVRFPRVQLTINSLGL